jgi:hypothetical protein
MLYSKTYGLQKETRNYLRRLYTFNRELASSDIADLDNFIKGTKQLGIWQNMVCWPLRSQHNLGSGSTVLSLGGLGNFNGTMVNSPSWGSNGLTFSATNQMNASVRTVDQNVTLLFAAAGNGGAQTSFAQYFGLQNTNTWSPGGLGSEVRLQDATSGGGNISLSQRNTTNSLNFTTSITNPFQNSSAFTFVAGSMSQLRPIFNIRNLNAGTTGTGTVNATGVTNLNRVQLNGRWDVPLALGTPHTAAFCGYITPAADNIVSIFNSLYKTTIGKGLGLP